MIGTRGEDKVTIYKFYKRQDFMMPLLFGSLSNYEYSCVVGCASTCRHCNSSFEG